MDAVTDFVSRRKDAVHYAVEVAGERIVVHSADPVSAMRKKKQKQLPPNLKQCSFCGFVTQYDDILMLHVRLHGAACDLSSTSEAPPTKPGFDVYLAATLNIINFSGRRLGKVDSQST